MDVNDVSALDVAVTAFDVAIITFDNDVTAFEVAVMTDVNNITALDAANAVFEVAVVLAIIVENVVGAILILFLYFN
jgi:hypothetical protein